MKFLIILLSASTALAEAPAQLTLDDVKADVISIVSDNHDKAILRGADASQVLASKKVNLNDLNSYFEGFKAGLYAFAEKGPAKNLSSEQEGDLDPSQKGFQRAMRLCNSKDGELSSQGIETLLNFDANVKVVNKFILSEDSKSLIVKFQSSDLPVVESGKVRAKKAYRFDAKNFGLLIIKHGVEMDYESIIFVIQ